jgi:prepilin-type N-terminal cleavage/methylation domain-containing protein
MTNKNLKRDDGFTIIEVLIVLAIAGLIMLIVFLAVPALQRNARNTSRKSDVGSLASAFSEYVDNNDGALPASCTGAACSKTFLQNWNPGYYSVSQVTYVDNTSAFTTDPKPTTDNIDVEAYATCSGETLGSTPSSRSVAILYNVETGSGYMEQCETAQ